MSASTPRVREKASLSVKSEASRYEDVATKLEATLHKRERKCADDVEQDKSTAFGTNSTAIVQQFEVIRRQHLALALEHLQSEPISSFFGDTSEKMDSADAYKRNGEKFARKREKLSEVIAKMADIRDHMQHLDMLIDTSEYAIDPLIVESGPKQTTPNIATAIPRQHHRPTRSVNPSENMTATASSTVGRGTTSQVRHGSTVKPAQDTLSISSPLTAQKSSIDPRINATKKN